MQFKAIELNEFGIVSGRDAIYLDTFLHDSERGTECVLKGEINVPLSQYGKKYDADKPFIAFTLTFAGCLFFQGCELDSYVYEKDMVSSFDLVEASDLLKGLKDGRRSSKVTDKHKHYVVQTYDYVYDIIATGFDLSVV